MIEVLVAALLLALSLAGGVTLFVNASDSSVTSERDSQLISVADQQIEMIREEVKTKGFDELAMSAAPASASNSTLPYSATTYADPNHFVSTGSGTCGSYNEGYEIEANYDNSSAGPATGVTPWSGCTNSSTAVAEPLEIIPAGSSTVAGFISPGPTAVSLGSTGQSVTVDEYVTDTYVGCSGSTCPTTTSGSVVCPSTIGWPSTTASSTTCADARRVIVAVIPTNVGRYDVGQVSPVYVSTIFANPDPSNSASGTLGLTLGLQLG